MRDFLVELGRRKVFRVAGGYAVVSWLLIQIAVAIESGLGLPPWFDGFVIASLAIGFPVALILAWAFEMTPEGVKRTEPLGDDQNRVSSSVNILDLGILAGLGFICIMMVLDRASLLPSQKTVTSQTVQTNLVSASDVSIAVLPFIDLSPDASQEYFADGMSEELLNVLAKIPELRVAARTSAFAFKGKDASVADIAAALSVGHVLEGSIRMSGDKLRITAQLIDGQSGYHLWSETYDRVLDDVFEVQDDIAEHVVETLRVNLLNPVPKVYTTDPAAYALFLQSRHLQQRFTRQALDEARALLEQVIVLDPDYAPAWTSLSSVYINQMINGYVSTGDNCLKAHSAAMAALKVDPTFAPAHAKLAALADGCDKDLQLAAHHYERALTYEPYNAGILGDAAVLAEALGHLDAAIAVKEYQVEQQPVNSVAHNNLALAYYFKGRFDDAEKAIRTTLTLSPDYVGAYYRLGLIQLFKNDAENALATFALEKDDEYRTKGLALATFSLGRQEEADTHLNALIEGWG